MGARVKRYTCSGPRDKFSLEADVYEGWVILAAQTGSFLFKMMDAAGDAAAANEAEANGDAAEMDRWERQGEAGFGELLLCPPGTTLWRQALEPMSFVFVEYVSEDNELFGGIPPRGGKIRIRDMQRLTSSFGYMNELHDRNDGAKPDADVAHLFADLLFLITHERSTAERLRERRAAEPLMHHAAAYIEQHACSPEFALGALADKLGIAGPQLTRRFQAAYGKAPVAYVTEVRLARARRLLVETDDTLDSIAEQCGYPNGFYLSRMFSRAMRLRPSAYRKMYRI
ncbi:AraC family transcriptional regulator [Paenibacillus koleovorans]|uniref:AraC family transcriptional regulator n=1 Tax=Paenibacillus koleovorans TaxID=121608 RepID=UPI000FD7C881|nr:AraC family transcriptional regulator [Paenibacillus koleovorans]